MKKRGNPDWQPGVSGNPTGLARTAISAYRADDLDVVTGVGRVGGKSDVRLYASAKRRVKDMTSVWDADVICDRVVSNAADDVTAAGYGLPETMPDEIKALHADFAATLNTAAKYDRAYGGAMVLAITADNNTTDLPLERIINRQIQFRVLNSEQFALAAVDSDPFSVTYGSAASATIVNRVVHASRFSVVGYPESPSRLQLAERSIAGYRAGVSAAMQLSQDMIQTVWRVKGLAQIFASKNRDAIKARVQATEQARSIVNAVLLDSEESFERQTANVAGFDGLMRELKESLASDCEMPLTMLLGLTPSGLSPDDKAGKEFWARTVSRVQTSLMETVRWFDNLLQLAYGESAALGDVLWNPVVSVSEVEAAAIEKTQAETQSILVNAGIQTPDESAKKLGLI